MNRGGNKDTWRKGHTEKEQLRCGGGGTGELDTGIRDKEV